jgi:hypothetical protein
VLALAVLGIFFVSEYRPIAAGGKMGERVFILKSLIIFK